MYYYTYFWGIFYYERSAKAKPKACLISCINYFVTIQIARKFIKKLSECIVSKKYFVWTLWPKAKLMVKVGLKLVDTHQMINVDVLLNSGTTGAFMDRKFAACNEWNCYVKAWQADSHV